MRPAGRGRRGVLIVSDYPGKTEDDVGRPLVGATGKFLEQELAAVGIDMWEDCWLTNALICHDTRQGKDTPKTAVDDCRPNLLNTIRELAPTSIALMGGLAVESLIAHAWKDDVGPLSRWVGQKIPCHDPNAWILPMNNPAFVERERREKNNSVPLVHLRWHLRQLAETTGVPWPDGPPDYQSRVEVILDPADAVRRIKKCRGGLAAFDYETTTLKPQGPHAEIVSCAICFDGTETFAFPWHGREVEDAMRDFLTDPGVGKIVSNLDMEESWTLAKLGVRVKGWSDDTMLNAHALDIRPSSATGLKFRAFAHLGAPDYSGHLEDYLESRGGCNSPNRIMELPIKQLLLYNGLDALLEYELAAVQRVGR